MVQRAIDEVDSSNRGTIDLEEFTDFLSKWDLERKLTSVEIQLIFNQLIDIEITSTDASMDYFMTALCHVTADHPNYDAKRAVFRVCRRILKVLTTVPHFCSKKTHCCIMCAQKLKDNP